MFEFSFNDAEQSRERGKVVRNKIGKSFSAIEIFSVFTKKVNSLVFDNVSKVQQRGKRYHRLII